MSEKQKSILIVEDWGTFRKILTDRLSREGFKMLEAKDGKEGLKMALLNKPDIILLDLTMPEMGGMGVLEKLREDEWGVGAQIIIMTNLYDEDAIAKAVEMGVHDYIFKTDYKIDELVGKIKQKLKDSQ